MASWPYWQEPPRKSLKPLAGSWLYSIAIPANVGFVSCFAISTQAALSAGNLKECVGLFPLVKDFWRNPEGPSVCFLGFHAGYGGIPE